MKHRNKRSTLLAAAFLGLAACGNDDSVESNLATVPATGIPEMVVVYPLGTAASLDLVPLRSEIDRLRRTDGSATPTSDEGAAAGSGQNSAAAGPEGSGAGGSTFAVTDLDDDNRLSPAEYAIHTLPSETPARQGATNDQQPPFVSDEALNETVMNFRKRDRNGDFFLSKEEFAGGAG